MATDHAGRYGDAEFTPEYDGKAYYFCSAALPRRV